MFIGKYFDWNQKRLKGIIDFYGHQFMVNKSILDLGCGYADISGPLHRLGAQVTALDGRKEHLDIVSKRYPGLKIVKSDLDREWLFAGQKFDLVLDLGLLCHVRDYESHLRNVCSVAQNLVLETSVCDDSDPYKNIILDENKAIYDLSINGKSSRPTAAAIERILSECGMTFQRINNNKFNSGTYKYDWQELNNSECDFNKRRIWFCAKDNSIPVAIPTSPVVDSIIQNVPTPIVLSNTNIHISTPVTTVTSQQENTMKVNNIYNNKIKFLLNTFSYKYFLRKTILDAGAGTGDFIGQFSKMGTSIITAIDGRQQNLALIQKKYPTIKIGKTNFEAPLSLNGKYDIVFSIDTLCHISNYEQHLSSLCARAQEFFLETAVCDSNDPNDVFHVKEDNNIHSLSVSGMGTRPSAARIEKILVEKGMSFIRIDNSALNEGNNVYDWQVTNSKNHSAHLRRFWICSKRPQVISEISGKLNLQEKNKSIQSIAQTITDATPVAEVFQDSSFAPVEVIKPGNKRFVIVIPSYKNEKWADKNILSALNQNYDKFRIIYTDDCSPDNTFSTVEKIVESHKNKSKVTLIKNKDRCGALKNLYDMIHSCDDDEIILTLDGDDWLADNEVLNTLNQVYQKDVWMTYGQYKNYPDNGIGIAKQIPKQVISSNNYRQYAWCSSHLRTFYTWLFKSINKEDLLHEGKFAPSAWDMYIMFPMLEMAGEHAQFINKILYIYNLQNPINDHKVDQKLQQRLDRTCRSKQKYKKISKVPDYQLFKPENKSIGLLIIATGKYDKFINQLIESADKLFFTESNFNVKYFIFTDSAIKPITNRNYEIINIPHKSFPYASMDRFKHFTNNSSILSQVDYLYYVDVDCKFVNNVSYEILSDLVGVRHCGFFNGGGDWENNSKSCLYLPISKYKHYYGGGFSGGKSENYLNLSRWCYEMIEKDLSNNIIPRFHDETSINTYFALNPPTLSLTPSYHYPQSNLNYYKSKWAGNNFEPKILLLDKNHKEVRS